MVRDVTPGIGSSLRDSFLASIVLGFVTYYSLQIFASIFDLNTFVGIFLQGLFSGILGIASGSVILLGLKNQEFGEFYDAFKDKVWKKLFVVTTEPEKLP